ncbi:septum site-determining protein MinC [Rivularia sp. PCC 7116]|uniref:septum site-determining protein MinC n=1 Tax=Rivularia sp. PCC 7116 TaxID=373994 RepID=UPI00029F3561|nr:septum site-determining protein MinC [Rivularia sp. PCC 7116]AFY55035.1 septum site-determining protein MinC [Rivularia sp. PCC 7116]
MTSEEAIPDLDSNNGVSETDSKVTLSDSTESTAIKHNDSVSNQNNVEDNSTNHLSLESVSNQTKAEEITVIPHEETVFPKTEVGETTATPPNEIVSNHTSIVSVGDNKTTVLENELVSKQPNAQEQSASKIENLNSDSTEQQIDSDISLDTSLLENAAYQKIQVEIRSEKDRLVLTLPSVSEASVSEYSWSEIWQQMKLRLLAQKRFFDSKISVHLIAHDRLLDSRQLQDIAETLSEMSLQLKSVGTSRRQTAIAAAGAGYSVEQLQLKTAFSFEASKNSLPPAEPLYLETTVRSGVEIRHRGSVIILGDVNPGGIVVAEGDILIWGRLRGVAHAGAQGNSECTIMALQMEPTQLRIADALARAPEKSPTQHTAEVAYMTTQGIRITKANDFSRISY